LNYTVRYHARLTDVARPRPGDRLLVATTNPGKIREIRDVLDGLPIRLLTLSDLSVDIPTPEETGRTFAANAAIKALAYAEASGLATVAEDSGLAIDALGGRPGVESARYPGDDYPEKFRNLYRELVPHPRPWTASYVCALAFVPVAPPGARLDVAYATEATVEGEITDVPRGDNGFGYDPIFFYPPYGATLGDVDAVRKLSVAHRGKAFRQFRDWLGA
jgi:XTP/dITP diphosphohydrolase